MTVPRFWIQCARAMLILTAIANSASSALAEAASVSARSQSPAPLPVLQRFEDPRPVIVAHRSCFQDAAENSLASLQSCLRQGIDAAEIDIRTTKDGALVLMHDADLDRMTNLTGPVSKYTLDELASAKLRERRGGPDSRLTNEGIPTLTQALRFAKGRIILFLDAKCRDCDEAIKREVEAQAAQDWVVIIGRMDNDYRKLSGWSKQQTMVWINDCKEQPKYPQMKVCFNSFSEGMKSFGSDRPFFAFSMSLDPGFFTESSSTSETRKVHPIVGTYVEPYPGITDEEILARTRLQWDMFFKGASPAIIDDHPAELLEYLQALGKR